MNGGTAMDNVEHAKSYQTKGYNCGQATFAGCSEIFGLEPELAFKVAGMFGGGICRMGETCGAVTGALMALGLKYAMVKPGDVDTKTKSYQVGREFIAGFKARNNFISCKELLKCDISTPEGEAYAKANNLHDTLCPKFIQDAVEIFNEMIGES